MNNLEYDSNKLLQDSNIINELKSEIEMESKILFEGKKKATLITIIEEQDSIMDKLAGEYDKLLNVCKELTHITSCIDRSRLNYAKCEDKISDLLDKIKAV